ncbi:hypothetical protein MnBA_01360 [Marinobacterium sp. BA1]
MCNRDFLGGAEILQGIQEIKQHKRGKLLLKITDLSEAYGCQWLPAEKIFHSMTWRVVL